jgi:hypothetical protein
MAIMIRRSRSVSRDDVRAVARLFDDFPATWVITGGWAIDFFTGHENREHEDLDIVVDAGAQTHLHRQLAGWKMYAFVRRGRMRWSPKMHLEWPGYEITAQLPGHSPPRFHILLNDCHEGLWRLPLYPELQCSLEQWRLYTEEGIPFNGPEVALLPKSRTHRSKDESDFQAALGLLDGERRAWLRRALEWYAPEDPWIEFLIDS